MVNTTMNKLLSPSERQVLLVQHKQERDKRVADRLKVVLLSADGWTSQKIELALFLDDSTVRRHLDDYVAEQRTHPNHKGSTPLLDPSESSYASN